MQRGALLTLDIEKPAVGGRMLARHAGQVVLVAGAIDGERVRARVERVARSVVFAETVDVVTASPDRRAGAIDWRCGGNLLAHIDYARQLVVKGQIIRDAFTRVGRLPLASVPRVVASPEDGYRMRARVHAGGGRVGFYREGTHEICDVAGTRQLLPATVAWLGLVEQTIRREHLDGLVAMEVAESLAGDTRACHLELHARADPAAYAALAREASGLSVQRGEDGAAVTIAGTPCVTDTIEVGREPGASLTLRRDVRAFFQGNRYLLLPLVEHVLARADGASIVDLYGGVGLFGLSAAARGAGAVTIVESDPVGSADAQMNAEPFGARVRVLRRTVEAFLADDHRRRAPSRQAGDVFIVDPPRAGLSPEARAGIVRWQPRTLVYVSCDVATLARDARTLVDAGYELGEITGMDLFPNTAHVEAVAVFVRPSSR